MSSSTTRVDSDEKPRVWTRLLSLTTWAWDSPTLMTWGSYLSKSLSLVLVLPLVLTTLPVEDVSLWYLLLSVISLQLLADLGFMPTFSRLIAYATSGVSIGELGSFKSETNQSNSPRTNWEAIEAVVATMKIVYSRLTAVAMLLLLVGGTLFLLHPIQQSSHPERSTIAWVVILVSSFFTIRGNQYSAFLQGLNKIPLVRRWEAIANIGATLTCYFTLLITPDILWLAIANQAWMVGNVLRNYLLCKVEARGRVNWRSREITDPSLLNVVWSAAWRSGLGSFFGQAPLQLSGLVYGQLGRSGDVAAYLVALQLLTSLRAFAMAPFYSKLPLLAKLRAAGQIEEQLSLAMRGMQHSHWIFAIGFTAMGVLGGWLTETIGSNVDFPPLLLWNLLSVGLVIERYGAMHLQLYTTTNHVVWHIANGVTAAIYALLSFIFYFYIGVYSFPVAYILSYSAFYTPYSARKSHLLFRGRFSAIERKVIIPMILYVVAYLAISVFFDLR